MYSLLNLSILQINAYDGNLTLYTKYELSNGDTLADTFTDPLIIISGNGLTITLKNNQEIPANSDEVF